MAVAFQGEEGRPDTPVVLPNRVFRLLVEAAVAGQAFDEISYLRANPDVAKSVREGDCPGAHVHYTSLGYYEDRSVGKAGFDEAWYLERYPDVKQAVAAGNVRSGLDHYCGGGMKEWRSPNAEAEADVFRWHQAITQGAPPRQAGPGASLVDRALPRRARA
jgi:hypothetical protein